MASAQTKFLITGGHMTPAFAVITELEKRGYSKFLWVGHKYNQTGAKTPSPEYQTVTAKHIPFVDLKAGKLSRNWDDLVSGIINLLKIPWGFIHSFLIILKWQPDVILSFGGYLALPVAILGKLMGKKVITHEQTVVSGLTNRIIPKFADKVLISWESSAKYYPRPKTVLTGNPIRPEIFTQQSSVFQFQNDLPIIYVTGGNQGSHKINKIMFEILPELLKHTNVIHQTGNSALTGDLHLAAQLKQGLDPEITSHYEFRPFIFGNEIGEVFAKSALAVSRAGANVTYELLALGKPSIFIPIPWVTHNEQQLNAAIAVETGIATIITEAELTSAKLSDRILTGLTSIQAGKAFDGKPLDVARSQAKSLVRMNAASSIADEIEKLLL